MNPRDWYDVSVFSNLAYVRWEADPPQSAADVVSTAVEAERIAPAVATSLFTSANPWVLSSFHGNDDTGFAASVFARNEEGVLAIRGTEANLFESLPFVGGSGLVDLLGADIGDIGLLGLAMHQAVSMVNYILALQTPYGAAGMPRLELHELVVPSVLPFDTAGPHIAVRFSDSPIPTDLLLWIEPGAPVEGLGVLGPGMDVMVTGHSLGGHLAALAIRLFPNLFDAGITFNAPGFDPITSHALTDPFVELISAYLPSAPTPTFGDVHGRLIAIESESSAPGDDTSVVASLLTGIPVGQEILVHVENNSHSMDQLMDALSVHALLWSLNPNLDTGQLFALYDGASPDAGTTEERLAAALSRVVLGKTSSFEPVEAGLLGPGDFADRVPILEVVHVLQAAVDKGELTLEPIWHLSADELVARASVDAAYRTALELQNPFVIVRNGGADPAHPGVATTPFDAISPGYWHARAEMLLAGFAAAGVDVQPEAGEHVASFIDIPSGTVVRVESTGPEMPDQTLFAGNDGNGLRLTTGSILDDRLFGGAGMDRLAGDTGADILDGGGGADVLYASTASLPDDGVQDWLEGGNGADVFHVGDGDVISDMDRAVAGITLSGHAMSGQYLFSGDGMFISADGSRMLRMAGLDAVLSVDLGATSSSVTIHDYMFDTPVFANGDFGLELVFPGNSATYVGGFDIVGTVDNDQPWAESGTAGPLLGTDSTDAIAGLEGDDYIESGFGNDFVDAGPGNDVVMNVVPGEDGASVAGVIFSGAAGNDLLSASAGADRLEGGDGQDFLQAGSGADVAYGQAGDDLVFGGHGDDIVYGGSGRDTLDGDKGLIELDPHDWFIRGGSHSPLAVLRKASVESSNGDQLPGADRIWGGSGADKIFGGYGDDELHGDSGDDTLEGQDGSDELAGDAGADRLRGGDGDDAMLGGPHADVLSGDYGDDILDGGDGADRLAGGPGDDQLAGGPGDDRYDLEEGDGWDVIRETPESSAAHNWLQMPLGHTTGDYEVTRAGNDLRIAYLGDDSGVVVEGWFNDPESILDEAVFSGMSWNISDLAALADGQGTRWDDVLYGTADADVIVVGDGNDVSLAGDGADVVYGGSGFDELLGADGSDILDGGSGDDYVDGGAGDDRLSGGIGPVTDRVDSLVGGQGSDLYLIHPHGAATTYILDVDAGAGDHDVVHVTGGVRPEDIAVRRLSYNGIDTPFLQLDIQAAGKGSTVTVYIGDWFEAGTGRIESFVFDDGEVVPGTTLTDRIGVPTDGNDFLSGSGDDVLLYGFAGADRLEGRGAANEIHGGDGADYLLAGGGVNLLRGGAGDDVMHVLPVVVPAPAGLDVLSGGDGRDLLHAAAAMPGGDPVTAMFADGGAGSDTLQLDGHDLVVAAGGDGFDVIEGALNAASVVIAVNRGEPGDAIMSTDGWHSTSLPEGGRDRAHVISFGGGLTISDVSLRQDGRDLLLQTGAFGGVRLVEYFDDAGLPADWLTALQFVTQATPAYDAAAQDPETASPVVVIGFAPLIAEFVAGNPEAGASWQIVDADWRAGARYLSSGAYGGQIAYEYALLGSEAATGALPAVTGPLVDLVSEGALASIDVLATEPVVTVAVGELHAEEGEPFSFMLPEHWIVDPLSESTLAVELSSTLPPWLSFDDETGVLAGTPDLQDAGTFTLAFTATNRYGQGVTVPVDLIVESRIPDSVVLAGSDAADSLIGAEGGDVIDGGGGADTILGMAGADRIDGGPGRDRIAGGDGDDVLYGGPGADRLTGGPGSDRLFGDDGHDTLVGSEGNDLLVSGPGRDRLAGGTGDDHYDIAPGSTRVSVFDADGFDTMNLSALGTADDVRFRRSGEDLRISCAGAKARILVEEWFDDDGARIERFDFGNERYLFETDVLLIVQDRALGARPAAASAPFLPAGHATTSAQPWDVFAADADPG